MKKTTRITKMGDMRSLAQKEKHFGGEGEKVYMRSGSGENKIK